jgi:hypothetical protein
LRALVEEQTAGSPVNSRKWVRHSVAHLTELLRRQGHAVSPTTVYRLLDDLGYSLRANRKRFTGPPHPDRDRQFAYIASQRQLFAILGCPVIRTDSLTTSRFQVVEGTAR